MKVIKLTHETTQGVPVNVDTFKEITRDEYPYKQWHNGEKRAFAICPKFDNPVVVLGIYKELSAKLAPHARHITQNIDGIGEFNPEEYEWCSYHREHCNYVRELRAEERTDKDIFIYNVARDHFDQVVYILEKTTGLKISDASAIALCENYVENQVDMYRGASVENILWMAIFAMPGISLHYRQVKANSPMYELLQK